MLSLQQVIGRSGIPGNPVVVPWLSQPRWWVPVGVAIVVGGAIAVVALTAGRALAPVAVEANSCPPFNLEQSETGAGNAVDLGFNFAGDPNCQITVEDLGTVTIELPEEVGVSGLDQSDVTIHVGGSFQPRWIDVRAGGAGNTREIKVPDCLNWRDYGDNPPDCDANLPDRDFRITLRNLRLPSKPPPDGGYRVSVKWSGVEGRSDTLVVYPGLQIDDHGESVRHGETVTFMGVGFESGASVNLYAERDNGGSKDLACRTVLDPNRRRITSARPGSDHGFTVSVTIKEAHFPVAGRYLVCPRDSAGNWMGNPIAIFVASNAVVLSGSDDVAPGSDVTLLLSGNPGQVQSVTAKGIPARIQSQSGNVLTVALPPRLSGVVIIRVNFAGGGSSTVDVTISEASLAVAGVRGDGIPLGGTAFVSASDLPGSKVCTVTFGAIGIALLDDRREFPDGGCIDIRRGGRFNATILVADGQGNLTAELIAKFASVEPGDKLELEVTDDAGHRVSAPVAVAVPEVILDPSDGTVKRSQPIIIRGRNFPPNRPDYYQVPSVTVKVGDRQVRRVYPSEVGGWEVEYPHTRRHQSGEWVKIEVSLGNHRPSLVTHNFRIRVEPFSIAVLPERVRIGTPLGVTVTGLEPSTSGYGLRIRSGPHVTLDGLASFFTTDYHGNFTGTALFPEYEPVAFDLNGEAVIFLEVVQNGRSLPGAYATLTQQRGHHPTPAPSVQPPTATPEPTLTPALTATPTATPIPELVVTPVPAPVISTLRPATPTPVPTDTPAPVPTIDRQAITANVVAAVVAPTIEALTSGGNADQKRGDQHSGMVFALFIVPGAGLLLFVVVAALRMYARR